jgi:murein DD-endopeptidase MepM/ murein hydrolase activator NlpD
MRIVESRSRQSVRVAAFVLVAVSAAGCSSDATRFNSSPMAANRVPPTDVTGSVPASRVDAQPLPPPPAGPNVSATTPYYRPAPAPQRTAELEPRRTEPHAPPARLGWHAGEAPHAPHGSGTHVVARGETFASIAHHYGKHGAEIARANNLPVTAKLRVGQKITIPGMAKAPVKTATTAAPPPAKPAVAAKPATVATQTIPPPAAPNTKVASNGPTATAHMVAPAGAVPDAAPETTGTTPTFRWPVRGRVIGAFGAKINGQQNDGINLSVPEGTSVKAAEDGVVAYAGNELKGYGNLVLLRHNGGFVTAYAHASEVMVKRGDKVKRGQIIAKAGQTGGVTSPQLHFEIRKGSTPVDPMPHLASGN